MVDNRGAKLNLDMKQSQSQTKAKITPRIWAQILYIQAKFLNLNYNLHSLTKIPTFDQNSNLSQTQTPLPIRNVKDQKESKKIILS